MPASNSIDVDVSDLPNVTADVILDPVGGLETVSTGVRIQAATIAKFVPVGGTTGQALTKNSGTNNDVGWSDVSGLPDGGTTGQVLTKASDADGDADWETPGGGGAQFAAESLAEAFSSNSTVENVHLAKKIVGNAFLTGGLVGIRLRAWGKITNNTTATTFTPRIRWNSVANVSSGSPITLLTAHVIQGTTTSQSNKHWDLDMMFTFNVPVALVTAMTINHTESTTGLPSVDSVNNGTSGVNIGSTVADRWIMLSWQMNNASSGLQVETYGAVIELLYAAA
jgi:hypothetical protein